MFEDFKPHLIELRKRLIIAVCILFVVFFITFACWEFIVTWMIYPIFSTMGVEQSIAFETSNQTVAEAILNYKMPEQMKNSQFMITTSMFEGIFAVFKVSFLSAFILSLPLILWQVWLFVAPGLYEHEKKHIIPFVFFATVMFVLGCAFCYYVVLPTSFAFAMNFGKNIFVYIPKISEYVDIFVKIMFGFGISFEFPVVSFFLAKIGLITDKSLKDFFRYAIVIIFIFAGIITPPDVISQILMAIPLLLLYAFSIAIVRMVNPYKEIDDDLDEENAKT
ncbi:MAG: twin-arginine translocase subunit TatC [Campylobacteraceae bacterium]|nr:twin-arginine translocase subunit TatC [Campylobacteraceae bacterium]